MRPLRLLASRLAIALTAVALAGAAPARAAGQAAAAPELPLGVTGTVRFHADVPSRHVAARHVEVWLPPGYDAATGTRYPVLYMHDGQNVFAPATSYTRIDWGVDEAMTRLIAERRVRPAIVVAVWNTPARFQEYMPRKALDFLPDSVRAVPQARAQLDSVRSDQYLRFLVEELKPFIDRTYRTRPGRADTFVMGSSMGGLISAYALAEYPEVFGGAGCVSTHWPAAEGVMLPYLARALPAPGAHRLWFDHGTATLDSLYAPYQQRADSLLRAKGWTPGPRWTTRRYTGAEHSERAWRARIADPLVFLLGR
jgi:predicted alpha/beta superfamily hydrolase